MTDTLLPPTSTPAPSLAVMRPGVRFMLAHPAHFIALGFGSGLSPIAPGTSGTLWAWLSFLALHAWLTSAQLGWLIGISFLVGWWACTVTARHMQIADSGHIVWDEIVAFWLVLWLILPAGFMAQAIAFALFRLLDALKPGPMAWADRTFKGFGPWGGFGILFDDLLAAFCTLLIIALWRF
jgi:phosphatidylglycerophosphatase A